MPHELEFFFTERERDACATQLRLLIREGSGPQLALFVIQNGFKIANDLERKRTPAGNGKE